MRISRARSSAAGAKRTIQSPMNSHSGKPHIALVARPVTSEKTNSVSAGPKASSETMRRSKASARGPGAGFAGGQNSGAAISRAGRRKKAWPPTNSRRMGEMIEHTARRRRARFRIAERLRAVLPQPDRDSGRPQRARRWRRSRVRVRPIGVARPDRTARTAQAAPPGSRQNIWPTRRARAQRRAKSRSRSLPCRNPA